MTSGRISQRDATTPELAQTMSRAYARHPAAALAGRGIVLALLGAALLGGCSDGGRPVSSRSATTGSTAAPEPQESSTRPEAVSPEQVVRRWHEASDAAQATGRTHAYRQLSDRCEPCDGFADRVEEIYSDGGTIEFGGSTVRSLRSDGPASDAYTLEIRSAAARVVDADGRTTSTLDGGILRLHVFLRPYGESWRVAHFTVLPR